jgi:hypothetical protein
VLLLLLVCDLVSVWLLLEEEIDEREDVEIEVLIDEDVVFEDCVCEFVFIFSFSPSPEPYI